MEKRQLGAWRNANVMLSTTLATFTIDRRTLPSSMFYNFGVVGFWYIRVAMKPLHCVCG
jgi:hypothetical protein